MTAPTCLRCGIRPAASGRRHCRECAGTSRRHDTAAVVVEAPAPVERRVCTRPCPTCRDGVVRETGGRRQCRSCMRSRTRRDGSRECRRCHERRPASAYPPMLYRGVERPGTLCDTCLRARGGHRTDGMHVAAQARYREEQAIAELAARAVLAACEEVVAAYGPLRVVVVARAPCGDVRVEVRDTRGRRAVERRGRDAYRSLAAAVAYAQATGARLG